MTLSLDLIQRLVATALPKSVVSFSSCYLSPCFRLPFFLFAAIKQNKVLTWWPNDISPSLVSCFLMPPLIFINWCRIVRVDHVLEVSGCVGSHCLIFLFDKYAWEILQIGIVKQIEGMFCTAFEHMMHYLMEFACTKSYFRIFPNHFWYVALLKIMFSTDIWTLTEFVVMNMLVPDMWLLITASPSL